MGSLHGPPALSGARGALRSHDRGPQHMDKAMTTIISRLYDSVETATAAADALLDAGHSPDTLDVFSGEGSDTDVAALAQRIAAARVGLNSAPAYAEELARGRALLVVRAPITPFGRAREAMRITARFAPVDVPGVVGEAYVRDYPDPRNFNTLLLDHRRFLSQDIPPDNPRRRGLVSAAFGLPLLSRRRPRLRRAGWPLTGGLFPLLIRRPARRSVMSGAGPLSRFFFPLPLLSGRAG